MNLKKEKYTNNFINNLQTLMEISKKKDILYTAGNFWKNYEKKIIDSINNNKLEEFRSWEGGSGIGSIHSFGGGSEFKARNFLRNYHPLDNSFNFIDESYVVKKYNSLINRLIPYFRFLKFFLFRTAELKNYYKNLRNQYIREKYYQISYLDKELVEIQDSNFGLKKEEFVNIDGKIYTDRFLNDLFKINFLKKNINFDDINTIVELGAGIGLLASVFLKLKKNVKYLIIDIPPTICFSSYFLKNLGFKVFDIENYKSFDEKTNINLKTIYKEYDVVCIPPWDLPRLDDFKFDLFVNVASFQEMEKDQVLNYLSKLNIYIKKFMYLCYNIVDKPKSTEKNSFGVKDPINLNQIEQAIISNNFRKIDQKKTLRGHHYNILFAKDN